MPVTQNARRWHVFFVSVVVVIAAAAIAYFYAPTKRGLLWLGLYTIPSHMFVSPFPHEPVLLFYAKSFPAIQCALVSLAGCLIAGLWDYSLFIPFIRHPRVRRKYIKTGLYRRSLRLFRKSPFGALVLTGLTPIPFYPIKFLSLADGYPMKRYLAALVVGRGPRYYAIAYLGYVLNIPNWILIAVGLALLALTLFNSWRENE